MRVVARVQANADQVEAVRQILVGLIQPTRDEPGCMNYMLLQNEGDPTDFTFVELWRDAAAFKAHLETAHFKSAAERLNGLTRAAPDIRRYHVVV
jgi:quinol monooxygenase YgiN